ncbi:hypothetical protein KKC59_00350, partial [bacterium]|nr:hypothetical protein [bacterium]
ELQVLGLFFVQIVRDLMPGGEKNIAEYLENFKRENPFQKIGDSLVIPFESFLPQIQNNFIIKDGAGVCRHHSILLAYLLSKAKEDALFKQYIGNGDVYYLLDSLSDNGHVWITYKTKENSYYLDSAQMNALSISEMTDFTEIKKVWGEIALRNVIENENPRGLEQFYSEYFNRIENMEWLKMLKETNNIKEVSLNVIDFCRKQKFTHLFFDIFVDSEEKIGKVTPHRSAFSALENYINIKENSNSFLKDMLCVLISSSSEAKKLNNNDIGPYLRGNMKILQHDILSLLMHINTSYSAVYPKYRAKELPSEPGEEDIPILRINSQNIDLVCQQGEFMIKQEQYDLLEKEKRSELINIKSIITDANKRIKNNQNLLDWLKNNAENEIVTLYLTDANSGTRGLAQNGKGLDVFLHGILVDKNQDIAGSYAFLTEFLRKSMSLSENKSVQDEETMKKMMELYKSLFDMFRDESGSIDNKLIAQMRFLEDEGILMREIDGNDISVKNMLGVSVETLDKKLESFLRNQEFA